VERDQKKGKGKREKLKGERGEEKRRENKSQLEQKQPRPLFRKNKNL